MADVSELELKDWRKRLRIAKRAVVKEAMYLDPDPETPLGKACLLVAAITADEPSGN